MKFWKPSSPKKSKFPSEVPRWTRRRTRRTMASRGISRFQPAARMLYHFALSEHSWAICRFPKVFWSLACKIYVRTLRWVLHQCRNDSLMKSRRNLKTEWSSNFCKSWLPCDIKEPSLLRLFMYCTKPLSLISHKHLPIKRLPITPFLTPHTGSRCL